MDFVGRKKEIQEIEKSFQSNHNEFVAVYGRRRVGKTALIKQVLEDKFDFYYTGLYQQSKMVQLNHFRATLVRYGSINAKSFHDWFEAFEELKVLLLSLNKKCVCVFIDELPWMDSKNSGFTQAFADFWNMWDALNPNHVILKLYICGSATTWMIQKIIRDKGGLHNRLTSSIHLKQFALNECDQYFKEVYGISYSLMELLDIYMCVGGVPYYLSKFDKKLPIAVQIDELFFSKSGSLRDEFSCLYEALFNNSSYYKRIINVLCSNYKGLTRDELIAGTKIEGGTLTECLENLTNCDFVRKYTSPKNIKKDSLYQITDLYTIFYLKFVLNSMASENHWTNMIQSSKVISWKGFAFERILLLHTNEIKKALGINGIACDVYAWNEKSKKSEDKTPYQIDLIIDRADNIMNICEIKYSQTEYHLSESYNQHVLDRIESFRTDSKTKKGLKNTFITTFGLSSNSATMPDISLSLKDIF